MYIEHGDAVAISPVQSLVDNLCQKYIREDDRVFLNFIFALRPTQEMLDAAMEACDIEALGAEKCILLSYVMAERPDLRLSDYAAPRIKNLISYFHFSNMAPLANFSAIGKALNEAGIPMILFGDAAFRYLRPNFPRPMKDVDILVPKERLADVVCIAQNLAYRNDGDDCRHVVRLYTDEKNAVNVHHAVFNPVKPQGVLHEEIRQEAAPAHAFGVDFFLPCHEDLLFLVLSHFAQNVLWELSLGNLYFTLHDSRFLLRDKENFDWARVRRNALQSGQDTETCIAAHVMNAVVPNAIPNIDAHFPTTLFMEAVCRGCRQF